MTSSTDVPVHHRLTPKQRQQLLILFHQSQMTRKDFVARHGVGLSTLSKWLQHECPDSKLPVSFQEVVMPTPSARWAVEIVSPKGWTFRLHHAAEAQTLKSLLRTLPC